MSPRTKKQFEEIREVSKEKILEAALELFGNKGYNSTSISDIVKKAGVSKGLLYHYFESKEELLRGMIANISEKSDELYFGPSGDSALETFENLIRLFFSQARENFHQWHLLFRLSVQIDEFDFVHQLAIEKLKGGIQYFEALLKEIGWPNPSDEAKLLTATFDGIGSQYFILNEDYHLDEMERILINKYCKK